MLDRWDHHTLLWQNDPVRLDHSAWLNDYKTESVEVLYDLFEKEQGILRVGFVPTSENMAQHLACAMLIEFDNIVFSSIEVRESPLTAARFYCSRDDLKRNESEEATAEKWPGEA